MEKENRPRSVSASGPTPEATPTKNPRRTRLPRLSELFVRQWKTTDHELCQEKGIMAATGHLQGPVAPPPDISTSPSNYVARGLPADLEPSNDQTLWFNELSTRITEMAYTTTNSSVMSLSNAVCHLFRKDRHCWVNWTEYVKNDDQSRKHCRTLTQEAKDMMEVAVCKHINKFTSFG